MSQTQCSVAGDGTPPIQDFSDAIGWNIYHNCRASSAALIPNALSHGILLMVINNLHVSGTGALSRHSKQIRH